jgi:hypothetical protein
LPPSQGVTQYGNTLTVKAMKEVKRCCFEVIVGFQESALAGIGAARHQEG